MNLISLGLFFVVSSAICLMKPIHGDELSTLTQFTGAKVLDANDGYKVSWALKDDELYLKLEMNAANSKGFMGFGLGEQTSGSMLGADIVTVRLSNGKVVVEDRNVPFDAHPIDNYSPDFPSVDNCQDWVPVTTETNATSWSAVIKRKVKTGDSQDRDVITDGPQRIIFAWSKTANIVQYHGSKRGASSLDFSSPLPYEQLPHPSDDIHVLNLNMDKYVLPTEYDTYYTCKGFDLSRMIDLDGDDRHIIRIDPVIQPGNEKFVHHILLHVCGTDVGFPYSLHTHDDKPEVCVHYENGNSPLAQGTCKTLAYGWAVGGNSFVLPDDVGMRIGNATQNFTTMYMILEIHYDNPAFQAGVVDSSGVKLYVTEKSALKKHDAAGLVLGAIGRPNDLSPNTPDQHYEVTCSSSCTNRFLGPVNVFGSLLHMHSFGKQIWTSHYPGGNMTDKHIRNRIDFWNFAFQQITTVNYVVNRGDMLSTHGVYDTSQSDTPVTFGEKSSQEMLFDFTWVYPASNLNGIYNCATLLPYGLDFCGGDYSNQVSPIPDGDISLSYSFGMESESCSSPSNSPTQKPGTSKPTLKPKVTKKPTRNPTSKPSKRPTNKPTSKSPTAKPTKSPKAKISKRHQ